MGYEHIAVVLLALHLLGDFPLQTDWMAANKFDHGPAFLAHLWVHLTLYAVILIMIYGSRAGFIAMFVAGCHAVIDWRRWAEPKDGFEDYPIWVDQSLHVSTIALAIIWFT